MHSYLKTIGFSSLSKAELNEILEEVVKNYDEKYVAESHPEHLYAEFSKNYGCDCGITVCGEYDEENQYYRLGISRGANEKAGFFKSLQYGMYEVKYWICTTVSSLKMLIMRQVGIDQMSGPVGIVGVVDETYQASSQYGVLTVIASMLNIAILLSANLGVMNLLPIPALDGGRLVFLFVEAIRRKKIPPEKEGYVHLIGFALLMALMVVVMFNDIRKLIM